MRASSATRCASCRLIAHSAALRFGIVDQPDGKLKKHREPVPYLGGLAIYLAFLLALTATLPFDREVLAMLLAGSIVVLLGLLDDLGQLGPWTKLTGQLVGALVLVKSGLYIQLTFVPAWIAVRTSSGRLRTRIFSITRAR